MNKSQLHQPSYEIFYLPFEISRLHDKIQYTVIQINTVKDALGNIIHATEQSNACVLLWNRMCIHPSPDAMFYGYMVYHDLK